MKSPERITRNEEIKRRYESGESIVHIAKDLNCSRQNIYGIIKRMQGNKPRKNRVRVIYPEIQEWMKRAGIRSAIQAAKLIGVSSSTFERVCTGKSKPKKKTRMKFERAIGLQEEDIFYTGNKP